MPYMLLIHIRDVNLKISKPRCCTPNEIRCFSWFPSSGAVLHLVCHHLADEIGGWLLTERFVVARLPTYVADHSYIFHSRFLFPFFFAKVFVLLPSTLPLLLSIRNPWL